MKKFFKLVLANIVALVIVGIITTILIISTISGFIAMSNSSVEVEDNTVLVMKLNGTIEERSSGGGILSLLGNSAVQDNSLEDILNAISTAKTNEKVKGIYIEAGTFVGAAPAMLQEIRNALVDFKSSGKFIIAYGDIYTQGAYYISSVADEVIINPQGMINWCGLASQVTYYKELLDKIGVNMQVVKVGEYKSAVEPYMLTEISEQNKEQLQTLNDEIWNEVVTAVSKTRKITAAQLNEFADSVMMFEGTEYYKKIKLVDRIAYSDEVPSIIAKRMKVEEPSQYNTLSVSELASASSNKPKGTSGNIIAVYYAYGGIVEEASSNFSDHQIISKDVCHDLKELADNEDVKAVVLRVNSGGGSAYASEQIWHQVMNIKAKKPIIVNMGGYAASGGYYISCAADWIVAEPTTLTGSIGIFGMFPDASQLINDKIGLHTSTVKTNQYADLGDITRPFNEGERAAMQKYINNGYDLFVKRCADGRKKKQADIRKIAEGHVWTGKHAKTIGLVDQLGNLSDAIKEAQKRAKIDEFTILSYPTSDTSLQSILNEKGGTDSYADAKMKEMLGGFYGIFNDLQNISSHTGLQSVMPFHINFNL